VPKRGLDRVLTVETVLVLGATMLGLYWPPAHLADIIPSFDLVFDTIGLLAALAVAGLAGFRYRESGDAFQLFLASAFLILAIPNAVHLLALASDLDLSASLSLADQGEGPLWAFTIARLAGGALLVVGARWYGRGRRPRFPAGVLLAPAVAVGAPALATVDGPAAPALAIGIAPAGLGALEPTPLGLLLGGSSAVLFIVAALLFRRRARASGEVGDAYLAVGFVLAAFSQAGGIADPTYAGVVTGADGLRLGFYLVLLVGLTVQMNDTIWALRAANDSLARLRDADVQRAALEERSRLARELHDGVAQDLWFAKLKAGDLASMPELGPDARDRLDDVTAAIDIALADSREAVMALREGEEVGRTLAELLGDLADDFEDRFGLLTERSLEPAAPWLTARERAELIQIAQQAMTNIGQHADATMAWIATAAPEGSFRLTVRDNGRGFDPASVDPHRFGLTGMRERAALIGAALDIESAPQNGTRVTLTVPAPPRAAPGGGMGR
jgi:signal transduction histidine kinase